MAQNTVPATNTAAYNLDGALVGGVPSPHDPSPVPVDEILIGNLRDLRSQSIETREGHGRELDIQTEHHQGEMNRLTRVIAACEAALQQLEPEGPASSVVTGQLEKQKQAAMQQQIQPRDHTLGQRP